MVNDLAVASNDRLKDWSLELGLGSLVLSTRLPSPSGNLQNRNLDGMIGRGDAPGTTEYPEKSDIRSSVSIKPLASSAGARSIARIASEKISLSIQHGALKARHGQLLGLRRLFLAEGSKAVVRSAAADSID